MIPVQAIWLCVVNKAWNLCIEVLRMEQLAFERLQGGFARVQKGIEVSSRGFARVQKGLEVSSRGFCTCTKGYCVMIQIYFTRN